VTSDVSLCLSFLPPFVPLHRQLPLQCFTHPITRPLSAFSPLSPFFPSLVLSFVCSVVPASCRPRCCPSLSTPLFRAVLLEASFVHAFVDCISAFPESASRRVGYPFTSYPISLLHQSSGSPSKVESGNAHCQTERQNGLKWVQPLSQCLLHLAHMFYAPEPNTAQANPGVKKIPSSNAFSRMHAVTSKTTKLFRNNFCRSWKSFP
jgi:hypothetical protein